MSRKRGIIEDEDAAELKLGEEQIHSYSAFHRIITTEFQDVQCLLISEVRVLLEVAKERSRSEGNSVMHSDLFPEEQNFHQFEMAQLANLCCDSNEEAKALIPSLGKKFDNLNDARLQDMLDQMTNLRRYQTNV
ncbi:RNA polymerase B [Phlyctochytrium planicorne]|nr:RNA polymerase B [Phlyctochytrium planicorne]